MRLQGPKRDMCGMDGAKCGMGEAGPAVQPVTLCPGQADIRGVRRDEITGQPLPIGDEEPETVVFAVLDYSFRGHPSSLAIAPPRAEGGAPRANIGVVVYHFGLPVIDFRYLGVEEILDLDWQDPWYSRFRNRNLRRQYGQSVGRCFADGHHER